jgi:hypothetical protein
VRDWPVREPTITAIGSGPTPEPRPERQVSDPVIVQDRCREVPLLRPQSHDKSAFSRSRSATSGLACELTETSSPAPIESARRRSLQYPLLGRRRAHLRDAEHETGDGQHPIIRSWYPCTQPSGSVSAMKRDVMLKNLEARTSAACLHHFRPPASRPAHDPERNLDASR